ncbi:hypothetical protein RP20_CCG011319 [Aedes albopictus]|nr:hypothetical protein RP20_CCG011319 [Aedes albopictus]
MATTMLLDAGLDKRYWGEACVAAAYVQNRLPTRSVDTTPYEKWCGRKPELDHLQVYGCPAYVQVPGVKRAKKLTFIGYSEESKGYRFVDTGTDMVTISREAKFLELQDPKHSTQEKVAEGGSAGSEIEWYSEAGPSGAEKFKESYESDRSEEEDYFDMDDAGADTDPLEVKEEDRIVSPEERPGDAQRSRRSNRGVPPGNLSDYVVGIARANTEKVRKRKSKQSGGD